MALCCGQSGAISSALLAGEANHNSGFLFSGVWVSGVCNREANYFLVWKEMVVMVCMCMTSSADVMYTGVSEKGLSLQGASVFDGFCFYISISIFIFIFSLITLIITTTIIFIISLVTDVILVHSACNLNFYFYFRCRICPSSAWRSTLSANTWKRYHLSPGKYVLSRVMLLSFWFLPTRERDKRKQKTKQKNHPISQLSNVSLHAVVEPGDEVLLLDPAYETYGACVTLAGGIPVSLIRNSTHFVAEIQHVLEM